MDGSCELGTRADALRRYDRRRLTQLFDDEFDDVYRFCLARSGDPAMADDAASEAFFAAARVFANGRGDEVDRPWLFVTARNRLIDQWRSGARHSQRLQRLINHQRIGKGAESSDSDLADRVLVALASLPERQRAALTLRHLDEFSVAEVAERLEVTYQAAESLLARARRSFAAAWGHADD